MQTFARPILFACLGPWVSMCLAMAGDDPIEENPTCDHDHVAVEDAAAMVSQEPVLIGSNCSYVTGLMLKRVLARGESVTLVARLRAAEDLDTEVAAPYIVGPEDLHVLANTVLEKVVAELPKPDAAVTLTGKTLTRQGVRYLAIVEAAPVSP